MPTIKNTQSSGVRMLRIISISIALVCTFSAPSFSSSLNVVTDIKPVHGLVEMVMEGIGSSDLIIESGASPHDFSLRPSQAQMLQDADVIFWMGDDLTPWLANPIKKLAAHATSLSLLEDTNIKLLEMFTSDGHDHGSHDPHAWLDPENGKIWLSVIATELAERDPINAEAYIENALKGQAKIDTTVAEITVLLNGITEKNLIVYHDAYRYFEERFGLSVVGAIALSDATKPSAARIAEIMKTVRTKNVACIFSEPQFNTNLIDTVTVGSEVNHAILDPLGNHLEGGAAFYTSLLKDTAVKVKDCAGL
jgi:zinc transport system substrate-binding protein